VLEHLRTARFVHKLLDLLVSIDYFKPRADRIVEIEPSREGVEVSNDCIAVTIQQGESNKDPPIEILVKETRKYLGPVRVGVVPAQSCDIRRAVPKHLRLCLMYNSETRVRFCRIHIK